MPVGLFEEHTIIGIDSDVRDIICAVHCAPGELISKVTTKECSFSIRNRSYKLRSGMDWIKQKELISRALTGMQSPYDRLNTRKECSNEGIIKFLNSAAAEHNSIHNFMRSYRHRENKGYNCSNRQTAKGHIAQIVLGTTNKEEPFKLCHTSALKHRHRQRRKKKHRSNSKDGHDIEIRAFLKCR